MPALPSPSWACQVGVGTGEAGSRLRLSPQPGGTLELGTVGRTVTALAPIRGVRGEVTQCRALCRPRENIQGFTLKESASEEAWS